MPVLTANELEKFLMHARVSGQFRVERRRHRSSLPHRDRILSLGCDHLHAGPHALDLGCADEHHFQRRPSKNSFPDRAVNLPPVSVAADTDVERTQPRLVGIGHFLRQHDGARAGTKCGFQSDEFFQFREALFPEDLQERSRLASRDDEAVDFLQLFRLADEHYVSAKLLKAVLVGVEIALNSEDSNLHT